jgi:hypothetical protein
LLDVKKRIADAVNDKQVSVFIIKNDGFALWLTSIASVCQTLRWDS